MKSISIPPITHNQPAPRSHFVTLTSTGLTAREYTFAHKIAKAWLAAYPGDLQVQFLLAQATYALGRGGEAIQALDTLCTVDPENLDFQRHLTYLRKANNQSETAESAACVLALGGRLPPTQAIARWGEALQQARQYLKAGDAEQATAQIQQALLEESKTPLIAVTHLQISHASGNWMATRKLLDLYIKQWPDNLVCSLMLADSLMDSGHSEQAVSLLHKAAANDVCGLAPIRLWGQDHPYRSLWPEGLQAYLDIPVPAGVAAALGWNQLPAGDIVSTVLPQPVEIPEAKTPATKPQTHPQPKEEPQASVEDTFELETKAPPPSPELSPAEILLSVQNELEQVGENLNQNHIARSDGRFPVYVVFSARRGLENKYGAQTAALLDEQMKLLVEAVRRRHDWGAILFYGDDPVSTAAFKVKPVKADDPWGLKLTLADLDDSLGKRGEMIGALLIVGGPEVVPFHHLPNPVDDTDADVPSDNPYATRDENYFIPEWPVGRVPGGNGSDPGPLLQALRNITQNQNSFPKSVSWLRRLWDKILARFIPRRRANRTNFGYTAEVWRKASLSVFRPIGEPRHLLSSPPTEAEALPGKGLGPAQLGYFNLHGLIDSSEWYGQRDPFAETAGPDYPVALRPQDVVNGGRAPHIVFSEACYGAHIMDKTIDQALALKFLDSGTQAVIGSTVTSYGSITTPLIAADLLGHSFWKMLRLGMPAGEALRRAKISLAREMHTRQGYLDGEDQKTLISFILYGDPLAQPLVLDAVPLPKTVMRAQKPSAQVKTVCDRVGDRAISQPVPQDVMARVKGVVEQYLPGMQNARLEYNQVHAECRGDNHSCPTAQFKTKSPSADSPARRVVVLSKQVESNPYTHHHYARMTFDTEGKITKLSVSR